ncbi:MAG: hypothetical protein ACM3MI_03810 [Clostridiales bacterium]
MENIQISNPEIEQVYSGNAMEMIGQGAALMQTKTPYSTAVQVIRARNLEAVERRCLMEAAIAGEEFLYQWPVRERQKDGSYKNKQLIGLSVGAALAIARNMGNNAVDVTVEEKPDAYYFHGAYIDLETGFNLRRAFRQRRTQNIGEKMKNDDRSQDIVFQIGQSKAIRNVVLNAIPVWLAKKVQDSALNSFSDKVEKDPTKYKKMCVDLAKKISVPLERLENKYGKEAGWDSRKVVSLIADLRTLEDGYDDIDNIFPVDDKEKSSNKNIPQADLAQSDKPSANANKQKGQDRPAEKPSDKQPQNKTNDWDDSNPENIENPNYWRLRIASFEGDTKGWNEFKKSNLKNFQAFGGSDYEDIEKAINNKEAELLKPGK